MIISSRAAGLLVAAACMLVASGCGQPSRTDLRHAAQSATPPEAVVLLQQDAECVEGARFPSCVEIYFRLGHRPLSERLNLFITNAQRHGWTTKRGRSSGGQVTVKIDKGSYNGGAAFWLDRYLRPVDHCNPLSTIHPCADHLSVQWGGHRFPQA
jgi:hypothetical protein